MPRTPIDPTIPTFQFELNPEKSELSQNTLKMYKTYLNKITKVSYQESLRDKRKKPITSKKDLLSKNKEVVNIINSLTDSRQSKCGFYSAVFYAVGKKDLEKNPKYKYIVEEFRKIYNTPEYEEYKAKKAHESSEQKVDE
jgi:hypothetical protein